jgi:two-component sensor histidine kinase
MFKFLSERIRRFTQSGITPQMTELEKRRIWLVNTFYLIGTTAYVAGVGETYVVDGGSEGRLLLIMAVAFQLGLVPLRLGKTMLAEFYLLFVANATLFVFENRHGPGAGSYLYYFPFMMIIAFLVDFRKPWLALINVSMAIGFMIAAPLLRYQFLYKPFPEQNDEASFEFNLVLSGLMTGIIALIIIRLSYRQYHEFLARMEERQRNEEKMKAVIREKETLLAEIHHRVKNNLAVISSLLNLQMNTVTNEYTRDVLRESRNRIASMALIHQKLYKNQNLEEVDFRQYAVGLVDEIRHSYPASVSQNVSVSVEAQNFSLALTIAVPCGLILNELLSNCYKHAFPNGQHGHITIRFGKIAGNDSLLLLEVEDNGVGITGTLDPKETSSLGMTLVQSLTEQIDGKWMINSVEPAGARFSIEFPPGRA